MDKNIQISHRILCTSICIVGNLYRQVQRKCLWIKLGLKGSKSKSYKCKTEVYLNLLIKSLVITWIVSGSSDFFAGDPFPESMDQSIVNFQKSSTIIATKSLSKHIATLPGPRCCSLGGEGCRYKKAKNLTTEAVSSRVTKEVDLKSSNQRSAS